MALTPQSRSRPGQPWWKDPCWPSVLGSSRA
ncbi:MAG: hypothetical protein QG608_3416, partial [Actinomycetota bacterium]|nr:hypothetical protein [Actinomycetota bacterium]